MSRWTVLRNPFSDFKLEQKKCSLWDCSALHLHHNCIWIKHGYSWASSPPWLLVQACLWWWGRLTINQNTELVPCLWDFAPYLLPHHCLLGLIRLLPEESPFSFTPFLQPLWPACSVKIFLDFLTVMPLAVLCTPLCCDAVFTLLLLPNSEYFSALTLGIASIVGAYPIYFTSSTSVWGPPYWLPLYSSIMWCMWASPTVFENGAHKHL